MHLQGLSAENWTRRFNFQPEGLSEVVFLQLVAVWSSPTRISGIIFRLRVTSLLFHINSFSFFFSQHRFHISVDCRSLIRLMLDPDEKTRITCEGILEDTWCEQGMEKVVDEMRRPSLAPDDTRSLPVMSNRKRSSIVPKPPTLPTIHSNGKQNISRRGEIPTSIGTRWSKFMKIKSNPP